MIVDCVFTQEARDPAASESLRPRCLSVVEKGKRAASDSSAPSSLSTGWLEQDVCAVNPQVEMDTTLARHLVAEEVLGSGAPCDIIDAAASQRVAWEAFSVHLRPCVTARESSSRLACRPLRQQASRG
ncbi:hypothetical protein SEVIR_4G184726v4 [Setaria viridis]